MKKIKDFISKIELIHIAIILILLIVLVLIIYQNNSVALHKISISENIEIEEVESTYKVIENINGKVKKIICGIETNKLLEKEYYNYVTGKGKGRDVNCSILLKKDNQYYKIKTLQGETKEEKTNFEACIKNKYLEEEYEIFLYDKEKQKIYKYTGGVSERNN